MNYLTKYKLLNEDELNEAVGGLIIILPRLNWPKCYVGTIGSTLVGAAAGPVGYWGGAMVGYATFCN